MATVSVSVCPGGNHVNIVLHDAGFPDRRISLLKDDVLDRRYSVLKEMGLADADLVMQIITVVKAITPPRTNLKIKNAVEAATYTIMDTTT